LSTNIPAALELLQSPLRRSWPSSGWLDWRKEKMADSTQEKQKKKLDPRVERLLALILEAQRVGKQPVSAQTG
jgi:hypothetical protein